MWHALKLHPYGEDIEGQKARGDMVKSVCYEEVLFSEPVEHFFNILTGHGPHIKGQRQGWQSGCTRTPTAEIPERITKENVYSREEESKELDRLAEAVKMVEKMITEEKAKLVVEDEKLRGLEKTEESLHKRRNEHCGRQAKCQSFHLQLCELLLGCLNQLYKSLCNAPAKLIASTASSVPMDY